MQHLHHIFLKYAYVSSIDTLTNTTLTHISRCRRHTAANVYTPFSNECKAFVSRVTQSIAMLSNVWSDPIDALNMSSQF